MYITKYFFQHLNKLDLSFNCFDDDSIGEIRKLVEISPQMSEIVVKGCDFVSLEELESSLDREQFFNENLNLLIIQRVFHILETKITISR